MFGPFFQALPEDLVMPSWSARAQLSVEPTCTRHCCGCQGPTGEQDHTGNRLVGCHGETSEEPGVWEAGSWGQIDRREEATVDQ